LALDHIDFGYNFRLPELQAIMASKQLAKIEAIVDERNLIRADYIAQLKPLGFVPQQIGKDVRYNVQSLVFKVPEGCDRDALILGLRKVGVESTIGTYALSGGTYYMGKYANPQNNAVLLEKTTITLPCFEGIDIDRVASAIQRVLQ
jgi:dTDP-4-amino-4,6-dideoxygalactose transaminase